MIKFPVESIIGLCYGGPHMDKLFVTTTSIYYFNYFDENGPIDGDINNPLAGQIFLVEGLHTKACPNRRRVRGPF